MENTLFHFCLLCDWIPNWKEKFGVIVEMENNPDLSLSAVNVVKQWYVKKIRILIV